MIQIPNIAVSCGFGFHREVFHPLHLKKLIRMTPTSYRQKPIMLNQFDKPDLLLNEKFRASKKIVSLVSEGLVLEMKHIVLEHPIHFTGISGIVPISAQLPLGRNLRGRYSRSIVDAVSSAETSAAQASSRP